MVERRGPSAEQEAGQSQVRHRHAQAWKAIAAQCGAPGICSQQEELPAAWQRLSDGDVVGIEIQHRCDASHSRGVADFVPKDGLAGRGHDFLWR
jgi:hypothetical protein